MKVAAFLLFAFSTPAIAQSFPCEVVKHRTVCEFPVTRWYGSAQFEYPCYKIGIASYEKKERMGGEVYIKKFFLTYDHLARPEKTKDFDFDPAMRSLPMVASNLGPYQASVDNTEFQDVLFKAMERELLHLQKIGLCATY